MRGKTEKEMLSGLRRLALDGLMVFSATDLERIVDLTYRTCAGAIEVFIERGWIQELRSQVYYRQTLERISERRQWFDENIHGEVMPGEFEDPILFQLSDYDDDGVRGEGLFTFGEDAPMRPSEDGYVPVLLLQAHNRKAVADRRILLAYGTALSFHGLSDVFTGERWYCWKLDKGVPPVRMEDPGVYRRSTRMPAWDLTYRQPNGQEWLLHASRRHPNDFPGDQRGFVLKGGLLVPCTGVERTLLDCWSRPDLAGGLDRVGSAFEQYLSRINLDVAGDEFRRLLQKQSDNRKSMRREFIEWIGYYDSRLGVDASFWKGLL